MSAFKKSCKLNREVEATQGSKTESIQTDAGTEHREFLSKVTLNDILAEREAKDLIDASAESNVRDAVKLMHDARIKHLPIFSLTPTPDGPVRVVYDAR